MSKKIVLVIFGIIVILALTKIFLTARLATVGTKLAEIEIQTKALASQNCLLEEEIAEFSSLARISSEGAKLGFSQARKVVSLTSEVPIAFHK